jgi:hypothetical protein
VEVQLEGAGTGAKQQRNKYIVGGRTEVRAGRTLVLIPYQFPELPPLKSLLTISGSFLNGFRVTCQRRVFFTETTAGEHREIFWPRSERFCASVNDKSLHEFDFSEERKNPP